MPDLEALTRRMLALGKPRSEIIERLVREIALFKDFSGATAMALAEKVLEEVENSFYRGTDELVRTILETPTSKIGAGEMGVGSRGAGDLFIHELLAQLASDTRASMLLGPMALDDAGVVSAGGTIIAVAVDGTHSRLNNFPFLAGFHVARAALRDVYVKGGRPVALFDDLHLADDADVSKIFDFIAGVSVVSELTRVPLVSGSTLRVGGDLVIGDRMVSCVGAVAAIPPSSQLAAKRNVQSGDAVLMTEGAGGGTIATTAIFSGHHDALVETLNLKTLRVCDVLTRSLKEFGIHCMTDVTNGGLRGDANTICREAKVGFLLDEYKIHRLVNPKIMDMLQALSVDYLGISLDSILVFAPPSRARMILEAIEAEGVAADQVGTVVDSPREPKIRIGGEVRPLMPKFRESAYTPVKKLVGEERPAGKEKLEEIVRLAFQECQEKRNYILNYLELKEKG